MAPRTEPLVGPMPLDAGLAAIDLFSRDRSDTDLIAAKCRALLRGYDARWTPNEYQVVSVEKMYAGPLTNPDTGRRSRNLDIAGVLDVVAQRDGRLVVIDHKSTSLEIEDPAGSYWRQLVVEGQVSHYMLLLWQAGIKPDEAVWDVMRKPGISPKKLSKADRAGVLAFGEYHDAKLSQASLDVLAGGEERETLEMYEARLAHDCIKERPQHYFQRRTIPRLDKELIDYARELWEHGQELLHVRKTNRHARNSGACMLYGTPCKFLGICSGYDEPDSDKWARKACVHNEFPSDLVRGDGRNVLTNSRIRCFQTCRRKHFYQYELGIERQDEEEREALLFGTLWHHALAAWWNSQTKGTVHGDSDSPSDPAGSGLGRYTDEETNPF